MNLDEIAKKYGGTPIEPTSDLDKLARQFGGISISRPTPQPSTERTWGEAAKDIAAAGASGLGGLLQFPGQLVGLVPGLRGFGEVLQKPGELISEGGDYLKSEGLKVREALRSKAISEAEKDGILSSFATAITSTIKDPALITSFVTEQIPLLLGPGGAAKLVQKLGAKSIEAAGIGLTGEAAETAIKEAVKTVNKRAAAAAYGTGSAMQAADVADDTYKDAYDRAIQSGMSPDQAQGAALNAARAAGVGAGVVSLLAQRLPGARAIEERLAGVPGTRGRVASGVGEAIGEALEEGGGQVFKNIGLRSIDPSQSLLEGVGGAAGLGALGGGLLGGALGKATPAERLPGQLEGETLYEMAQRLNAQIRGVDEQIRRAEAPPPPGAPTAADIVDMYRTQGYGVVRQYQSRLDEVAKDQSASPEDRKQAATLSSEIKKFLEQVGTEQQARKQTGPAMTVEELLAQAAGQAPKAPQVKRAFITGQQFTKEWGFDPKDPVRSQIVGKDMSNRDQAREVLGLLEEKYNDPNLSDKEKLPYINAMIGVNDIVSKIPGAGFYAGSTITKPSGAGVPVAGVPAEGAAAERPPGTQPTGVVSTQPDVGQTLVGEGQQPAPVDVIAEFIKQKEGESDQDYYKRLSGRVGRITEMTRNGQITAEQRTAFDNALESARVKEQEAQRKTISELSAESQRAFAIAEEMEQIGGENEKAFAQGIRSNVRTNKVTPQNLAFYEQRLADTKRLKTEKKTREALGDNTYNRVVADDPAAQKKYQYVLANATEEEKALIDAANKAMQDLAAAAYQAGYDIRDKQAPAAIQKLNSIRSVTGGSIGRLVNKAEAIKKGFKRADPASLAQAKAQLQKRIDEAKAALEGAKPSLRPSTEQKAAEILKRKEEAEAKIEAAPEAKPEEKPLSDKELLAKYRADLIKQLDGALKAILNKYGLKGVKLDLNEAFEDEGSYQRQVITLALNVDNPVRVLRHESVHALKEMGFFTDAQWKTLEKRAREDWVEKLKLVKHSDTQSRYDAYVDYYTKAGQDKGLAGKELTKYVDEVIIEEAIADAFGVFEEVKAPPGLINAIRERMHKLFKAIKQAFNAAGVESAEDIFGKIEAGKLKPTLAVPVSGETKGAAEEFAKPSLRSPLGFYSALERGVGSVNISSAPPQGWKDAIKGLVNKGEVKSDEVEWSGVNDWLDLQKGKVSKDAVQAYLKEGGVRVEETMLGNKAGFTQEMQERLDDLEDRRDDLTDEESEERLRLIDAENAARDERGGLNQTKYGKYTLPGGENYREVLLRLPLKQAQEEVTRLLDEAVALDRRAVDAWEDTGDVEEFNRLNERSRDLRRQATAAEKAAGTESYYYQSRHWDQPNVLAHIRVNDRTDADGKKVLFVEEIQSDWGQEGKKEGFTANASVEEVRAAYNAKDYNVVPFDELTQRDKDFEIARYRLSGLPPAPFVTKTEGWLNLALKRIITMATQEGYDRVAFVNGEQSAERYNLSKQLNKVLYSPYEDKTFEISAILPNGQELSQVAGRKTLEEIERTFGKEIAQKIQRGEKTAEESGVNVLSGLDLKVGGEGIKTFYDKIVPIAVNKLLPKVGGEKMVDVEVLGGKDTSPASGEDVMDYLGIPADQQSQYWKNLGSDGRDKAFENYRNRNLTPTQQPGFDVTDSMRQKVADGIPMMSLRADSDAFKFWFGQSTVKDSDGKPKQMYTGAGKDYLSFVGSRREANAIFVTDDPTFAAKFAKDSADRLAGEGEKFLNKEQIEQARKAATAAIKRDYGKSEEGKLMIRSMGGGYARALPEAQEYLRKAYAEFMPSGANIIPVYVKAESPFDFANEKDVNAVLNLVHPVAGSTDYLRDKRALERGEWELIEKKPFQDAIRALGFDGFYVNEQGRKSLAVYNSNQLKSVFNKAPTERPELHLSLRSLVSQAMTPAMTATVNKIAPPTYNPNLWQRILDGINGDTYTAIRQRLLNRYERLAEYDRRVAAEIRRAGGIQQLADSKAETAALFSDLGAGLLEQAMGANDRFGGVPVYRNGMTTISNFNGRIKGPILIFKPLSDLNEPDVFRLYQTWSAVNRGVRLDAEGRENLIDQTDINAVQDMERNNPNLIALFKSVKKDWIAFNDALVQYQVDTGVITPQMAAEWRKHGDYFPFYRLIDDTDVAGPKMFSSIANVKPSKKLKGGESPLGDFFENIVRNSQAAIQAGIKNTAANRATEQAVRLNEVTRLAANPQIRAAGAGVWDVMDGTIKIGEVQAANAKEALERARAQHLQRPGASVYRVLENGKEVYYKSHDPLFIEAIKSLNMPDLPFIGLLAGPANILRNLVTKDPAFMLANMMRDSLSAHVTAGTKMIPIWDTARNFAKAIANKSPETRELYAAGVLGGYDYSRGIKTSAADFQRRLRELSNTKTPLEKLATPFTSLWGALEKGTQASDAATRAEIYKRVLAETGNVAEAYWQALEVMNFNRKGNSPVVRILTAGIPFLNARMQGLDVLFRTAIFPLGGTASEQAQQRMKTFWVRGMTMMAISSMYWLATHDDDDYKKQEQETKDNNWLIPALGIKIPIPFEVGVMFKVIPERIMALTFGTDTTKDFKESMKRQFLSTFSFTPIPQVALPALEVGFNHSVFTGRPIIGRGLENVAAPYQIAPGTSRVAEMIGKSLGYSPIKTDYLIKGYTGTIGQYAVDLMDMMFEMTGTPPKASKRFEQMPVIKRFALDPEARGNVTAYYELKDSVDEVVRTTNLLERSMNYADYGPYMKDNIRMFAVRDYINDLEKQMKDFREMKTVIMASQMDGDQKRDALTSIGRMEQGLTRNIQTLKKAVD